MIASGRSRRGQVLVLFVLMLPVILGMAALAFDAVYAFMVKAALASAVDAAALAGARAIVNGSAAVNTAVTRTFQADFPAGYLTRTQPTFSPNPPTIVTEADGTRSISLVGSATSPSILLGVLGFSGLPVRAFAKAGRRNVNIVLVLDRSGSLDSAHAWDDVQRGASFFVQQFDDARDRVGLVSFATTARLEFPPQINFRTSLLDLIGRMRSSGATTSALGLYTAYDAMKTLNDTTADNVIVYFTDGQSNGFPAQFDVYATPSTHNPRCASSPVPDGVYFTTQTGTAEYGIFKLAPPGAAGTWPDPDYEIISGCTGLHSSGDNGEDLLSGGFRATWNPSFVHSTPISVFGPESVNLGASGKNDGNNVMHIGDNMLVNVATAARTDPLNMRIYAIGLGGYLGPARDDILQRVANVAPYTVSTQPIGLYVYAPSQDQLEDAFRQVASSVSRLIQ